MSEKIWFTGYGLLPPSLVFSSPAFHFFLTTGTSYYNLYYVHFQCAHFCVLPGLHCSSSVTFKKALHEYIHWLFCLTGQCTSECWPSCYKNLYIFLEIVLMLVLFIPAKRAVMVFHNRLDVYVHQCFVRTWRDINSCKVFLPLKLLFISCVQHDECHYSIELKRILSYLLLLNMEHLGFLYCSLWLFFVLLLHTIFIFNDVNEVVKRKWIAKRKSNIQRAKWRWPLLWCGV